MDVDVLGLLPHRPPMVLVESVEEVDEENETVRCTCRVPAGSPLTRGRSLPGTLLIEMLAQSAACYKGWMEHVRGNPVRPAYLVRVDDLEIRRRTDPSSAVEVEAVQKRALADYYIYSAEARCDGRLLATGVLRFVVEEVEEG